MVGAILLIIIAVASAGLGLVNWVIYQKVMEALLLGLIATVALGSALIIDGIRFYADKIGTQLNYLLMPGRQALQNAQPAPPAAATPASPAAVRPASGLSNSGANLNAPKVSHRYRIIGKDRGNGMDTELVVQAADQTAALRLGEQKGIDVRRVEPVA